MGTDSAPEVAVPYAAFKAADFVVQFATEYGRASECDLKTIQGITHKLLVRFSIAGDENKEYPRF